ncbi:hypothetical protein CUMW_242570 [Citrus unshiu]|uniref:Uncharacterized protein n=1 Tax=Citrus unshiu TaxID=55188 RepID=A0A2H5QLY1_CITUN|nr:hypothetical protein CUMW_242570 [Citrus unshiu]
MRPVIMVDYGGKMPELQEHLCELLKRCQKESTSFEHLRVMVIEDMIYLIHVKGLAEYVSSSLSSEAELHFVDLEQDPPKVAAPYRTDHTIEATSSNITISPQSTEVVDLSSCICDSQVTIPTLNGLLVESIHLPHLHGPPSWLAFCPLLIDFSQRHLCHGSMCFTCMLSSIRHRH